MLVSGVSDDKRNQNASLCFVRRARMNRASVHLKLLVLLLMAASGVQAQPIPVIFDTDMGNDVDDALALAMLHALADRGEVQILAVTLTKDNAFAGTFVNVINTFYGRPEVPIGMPQSGVTPDATEMIQLPSERRDGNDQFVYPRTIDCASCPSAVAVLREALAGAADGSVVIIQVGFSTNLARLLATGPDALSPLSGRDLVMAKVRLLSVMAGDFAHTLSGPEYNIDRDIPSARKLFDEWPTPIVASGFEVGNRIHFPAASIERDFRYVEHHPLVDAYRHYMPMPYDRPTWDLTSVLAGIRPDDGYFGLSRPGQISVDDKGFSHFVADDDGAHRYLKIDSEAQRQRALEAMVLLASQPPR